MKILLGALAVLVLLGAVTPVIAMKNYWSLNDSYPGKGLRAYHLLLDGTYPSFVSRSTKLVNQNLSTCLGFYTGNDSELNPPLCHQIKESDIPKTNDSILDVGYFLVSDKLNATNAQACIRTGYHNWSWCNSLTLDDYYSPPPKLLADLGPTYEDVSVNNACITHHLKEGTQEFRDCEKG
jgi:hypothetical protein